MNEREFEVLVRQHTLRVVSLARKFVRNEADAQEVVSTVWLKVWVAIDRFDGRAAFTTWLYTITYNASMDLIRRRGSRQGKEIALDKSPHSTLVDDGLEPDEMLRLAEFTEAMEIALVALEPHHHEVLLLRREGASYDEIARVVHVSKGTVMSRLFHARRYLAELLEALGHTLPAEGRPEREAEHQSADDDEAEGEQEIEHMGQEIDINDRAVKRTVYLVLWGDCQPIEGTDQRFIDCDNPAELMRGVAHKAVGAMSRDRARALLYKMGGWVRIERQGGRHRLTCLINPARLDGEAGSKPAVDGAASNGTNNNGKQPLRAGKAYAFLYKERGLPRDGHPRWVDDAEGGLFGKFGPGRDYAATVLEIVENKWGELEGARLKCLVRPDELKEKESNPPQAGPVPEAPVLVEPPKSAASERRSHGLKAVHMLALEKAVWRFFCVRAAAQERGGWDLEYAPEATFEAIMAEPLANATRTDYLEAIGRFCASRLLVSVATGRWRLAWNPTDVACADLTYRRIILVSEERAAQIRVVRQVANRLADGQGKVPGRSFCDRVAEQLAVGPSAVRLFFLGCKPEAGGTNSFGLIMHCPDSDGDLLVTEEALSGCDYLPGNSERRSVLIRPNHDEYAEHRATIQRRYLVAAAGFPYEPFSEVAPPPSRSSCPAPPPKPPVEPVATRSEASTSVLLTSVAELEARLIDLRTRRKARAEQDLQDGVDERRLRAEAADLRHQADDRERQADELVTRQRATVAELDRFSTDIAACERVHAAAVEEERIAAEEAQLNAEQAELEARLRELAARKAALRPGQPPH